MTFTSARCANWYLEWIDVVTSWLTSHKTVPTGAVPASALPVSTALSRIEPSRSHAPTGRTHLARSHRAPSALLDIIALTMMTALKYRALQGHFRIRMRGEKKKTAKELLSNRSR